MSNFRDIAIAIAWPETLCKQPGSWYDPISSLFRISKDHYYKAGHAALVLIRRSTGSVEYFDFGRYHAPFQHGRVRSAATDFELDFNMTAEFGSNGSLSNYLHILHKLNINSACHGDGKIVASQIAIDYEQSKSKAQEMQNRGFIPYGPFVVGGSNCSRFVNEVIHAGAKPSVKLKLNLSLSPTPMWNVKCGAMQYSATKEASQKYFDSVARKDGLTKSPFNKNGTLLEPTKNNNIPKGAKWLSGEGAGSWFAFECIGDPNKNIKISKFSPSGTLESISMFTANTAVLFDKNQSFELQYPCNSRELNIVQNNKVIKFNHLEKSM